MIIPGIPSLHSRSKIYVIRLKPHEDLKLSLLRFAEENGIRAAVILTCVGSLVQYNLRFANRQDATLCQGHFEILSLAGTLSQSSAHLHLCIADHNGVTTGGHLLNNNLVFTTAEIALVELTDLAFEREFDPASGYAELGIRHL